MPEHAMPEWLLIAVAVVLLLFLAGLAAALLLAIFTRRIDLARLLSEPNGDASMSRLQLLVFTFVIAISVFCVVVAKPTGLPDVPSSILTLLGISGSSYVVSKAIQFSQPDGIKDRHITVTPLAVTLAVGATQRFVATMGGEPAKNISWSVDAEATVGTIDKSTGVYTAVAKPSKPVTVTATTPDETIGTGAVL